MQFQTIAIVVLVLGAAAVALMCDMLKRNNDQLRELAIEFNVRMQHEEKQHEEKPAPVAVRREPVAPPANAAFAAKKRSVNAEALAVMERGAALASSGKSPVAALPAAPKPAPARAPKKDWGTLIDRSKHLVAAAEPPLSAPFEQGLQTGFHEGHVLNKLVQSRQPISGLVVSIGVNAAREADGKLPESVHNLVHSLIGPADFAAQSGADEFLLIYPGERGASAQRRLSMIAQQLWDFQLRSLGSFEILFSWGGVEVRSESIEEAIASASDRMQETKRGRKLVAMPAAGSSVGLRKAV